MTDEKKQVTVVLAADELHMFLDIQAHFSESDGIKLGDAPTIKRALARLHRELRLAPPAKPPTVPPGSDIPITPVAPTVKSRRSPPSSGSKKPKSR